MQQARRSTGLGYTHSVPRTSWIGLSGSQAYSLTFRADCTGRACGPHLCQGRPWPWPPRKLVTFCLRKITASGRVSRCARDQSPRCALFSRDLGGEVPSGKEWRRHSSRFVVGLRCMMGTAVKNCFPRAYFERPHFPVSYILRCYWPTLSLYISVHFPVYLYRFILIKRPDSCHALVYLKFNIYLSCTSFTPCASTTFFSCFSFPHAPYSSHAPILLHEQKFSMLQFCGESTTSF